MAAIEKKASTEENLGPVTKEFSHIEWEAYSRPFKTFNKETYINIGAIFLLLGLILFVIEGVLPAILLASVYFIFYVLTTVEPHKIHYSITNYGIMFDKNRLFWEEMGRYSFAKRFNTTVLIVETANAPWKMEFVIDEKMHEKIEDYVSSYLYKNDTPPNIFEKSVSWVSSRIKM